MLHVNVKRLFKDAILECSKDDIMAGHIWFSALG